MSIYHRLHSLKYHQSQMLLLPVDTMSRDRKGVEGRESIAADSMMASTPLSSPREYYREVQEEPASPIPCRERYRGVF
jgi:hypothetical protein